jgi:hypothetical protein
MSKFAYAILITLLLAAAIYAFRPTNEEVAAQLFTGAAPTSFTLRANGLVQEVADGKRVQLAGLDRAIALELRVEVVDRLEAQAAAHAELGLVTPVRQHVLGVVVPVPDGGADAAYAMVDRLVVPRMPDTADAMGQFDQKTQLQELSARLGRGAPVYEVTSHGPDHAKTFHARVLVDREVVGVGMGRSKKAAEQVAATDDSQFNIRLSSGQAVESAD